MESRATLSPRLLRPSRRAVFALFVLAAATLWWWRRDIAEAAPILWWLDPGVYVGTDIIMQSEAKVCIVPGFGMTAGKREAAQRAFGVMREVERLMSKFDDASDVGRLNRQMPGARIEVNPLTWEVVMQALRLHRLTDGAFDITVEPLLRLYRERQEGGGDLPSPEAIAEARQRVGSEKILYEREGMRLGFKLDGMAVDLGALAPGFAVDRAAAELRRAGVENALVEMGGEVRLLGKARAALVPSGFLRAHRAANNGGWRIAIRHPRRPDDKIAVLDLGDCAIATSGDYENYFICQGKRYSHIVDPRTGYPVSDDVVSATVIHPHSCLMADALATAFCVLGAEAAERWLKELGGDMPDLAGVKAILFKLLPDGSLQRIDLSVAPVLP